MHRSKLTLLRGQMLSVAAAVLPQRIPNLQDLETEPRMEKRIRMRRLSKVHHSLKDRMLSLRTRKRENEIRKTS